MNDKVKILIDEVRKLSEVERERLMDALDVEFGMSQEDIDRAWFEEAERRSKAVDEGRMRLYDADETIKEIRDRLARRRAKR